MSQQQKNQYINTIFNEFYDNVIKEYNNNNIKKIQYKLNFISSLFSNMHNLQLKNCNYPISNCVNNINFINSNINYIKSDIIFICNYFQHECVYDIFTEIVKAITLNNYIVTKQIIDNNFNLEKYADQFNNLCDCKLFITQFYNVSLNNILINIYSIYDSDYEEYIIKNKEFNKLMDIYNKFIREKYNLCVYNIYFDCNIKPINYYNFIIRASTISNDNFNKSNII